MNSVLPWLTFKNLIVFTGALHFTQIPAMIFSPKMLNWEEDLGKLSAINRKLVLIIGLGIFLVVQGLGVVVIVGASEIASGTRLGAALSCFLGCIWLYRWSAQVFVYRGLWPGGWLGRASYYGLAALFTFFVAVYFTAFAAAVWGR